jgi:UDP-N-acetylmuramyl pentapeptide phosphotransferase/UDP-N-acetylglucosamine-1-phosphate transferase
MNLASTLGLSETGQLVAAYLGMAGLAAALCATLLAVLLKTGLAWRIALDHPNERSLHSAVVPRCGGWGVVGALLVFLAASLPLLWQISAGLVLLALVSFVDDRRGLPIWARLIAQAIAVFLVMRGQIALNSPLWYVVIALGWLWMINLYNFMDGSDGLAGVMAMIGFSAYAIAFEGGAPTLSMVSVATAGAALGFLYFNWSPARLFLGDAGSIPLGFLAGAIGYLGYREGHWPLWFPPLVFSPFVVDASVTLVRRALRRQKIWSAHREHFYQRLIQSGYSHRRTAVIYALTMLGAAALALSIRTATLAVVVPALCVWLVILAAIGAWIERRAWRASRGAMAVAP